jgi:hypothetical protein
VITEELPPTTATKASVLIIFAPLVNSAVLLSVYPVFVFPVLL